MKNMRKLLISIILVVLLIGSVSAFSDNLGIGLIKQGLLFARTLHKPLKPITPRYENFNNVKAYELQNWLVGKLIKLKHAKIVGFKAAFTSSPSQKKFGTNAPAYGVLLDYMKLEDNAVIDHSKIMKPFIEVEVGFRFSKDITKPIKYVAELKRYVDAVFPGIEIPSIRFTTLKGVKAADVIADDVGSAYFIVGKMLKSNSIKAKDVVGILSHNGKVVRKGAAKAVLGNPWNSLLWVVNNVLKSGGTIKKDEVVITGTMISIYPLKPGKYLATYGELGEVNFVVK